MDIRIVTWNTTHYIFLKKILDYKTIFEKIPSVRLKVK